MDTNGKIRKKRSCKVGEAPIDRYAVMAAIGTEFCVWKEEYRGREPTAIERVMVFPPELHFTMQEDEMQEFKVRFEGWCSDEELNDCQRFHLLIYLTQGSARFYLETTKETFRDYRQLLDRLIERNREEMRVTPALQYPDGGNITRAQIKKKMNEQKVAWEGANRGPEPTNEEYKTVFPGYYVEHNINKLEVFRRKFKDWYETKNLRKEVIANLLCFLLRGEARRLVSTANFVYVCWSEIMSVLINFARTEPWNGIKEIDSAEGRMSEHATRLAGGLRKLEKRVYHMEGLSRDMVFTTSRCKKNHREAQAEVRKQMEWVSAESLSLRQAGSDLEDELVKFQFELLKQEDDIRRLHVRVLGQNEAMLHVQDTMNSGAIPQMEIMKFEADNKRETATSGDSEMKSPKGVMA